MQRFTIGDAAELAGDVGPDPRLIGVLAELDAPVEVEHLRAQVSERMAWQPILSRRFVRQGRAPWSAVWERVEIDIADHVLESRTDDPVAATVGTQPGRRLPDLDPGAAPR